MSEPRLVFAHTFEGLYEKALKDRFTPELRGQLKTIGVDFDRKLDPAYPAEVWAKALEVTARAVYPSMSLEDACDRLGWEMLHGFFDTTVGVLMRGIVKVFGPARTLERAGRTLRTGNNYTEAQTRHLGGNKYELIFNEPPVTRDAMRGCVRAGVELAGAKDVRITTTPIDGQTVKFTVEWA